jgi:hypothetical protein
MPTDDQMSRKQQRRGTRQLLLWTAVLGVCVMAVAMLLTGALSFKGKQIEARNPPPMSAPSAPPTTTGQR